MQTQTKLTIEGVNAAVDKLRAITVPTRSRRCLSTVGGEENVDAEGREYVTAGIHAPSHFRLGCRPRRPQARHRPHRQGHLVVLGLPHKVAVEIVTRKRRYEIDPADQAVIVRY